MASLFEQSCKAPAERPVASVEVRIGRWMLTVLAVLMIAPWVAAAVLWAAPRLRQESARPQAVSRRPAPAIQGRPGPWGCLEYVRLRLELPDELVFLPTNQETVVRWFFKGYTKEQATELLQSAGLTDAQLDFLLHKAVWTVESEGVSVEPGDETILGLAPAARSVIYSVLVEFPENSRFIDPLCFRPDSFEDRVRGSGLSPQSVRLLRSLLYQRDEPLWMFADVATALRQLPSDSQRRQFVKTISGKPTVLARLKIDADSDIDALAAYWGMGGRRKDIAALLGSLARVRGGCGINLVYLLPRFAREHLYNFPYTSVDAAPVNRDCFWTAMNLFSEEADDRLGNSEYVREVLGTQYETISEPSRFGDLIFLATRDGVAIHAAVFLADDLVFTKNGVSYTQPWLLMHVQDMIDTYAVRYPTSGPLQPVYYRKKGL